MAEIGLEETEIKGEDYYWTFALLRGLWGIDPLKLTLEQLAGYTSRIEKYLAVMNGTTEEKFTEIESRYKEILLSEGIIPKPYTPKTALKGVDLFNKIKSQIHKEKK